MNTIKRGMIIASCLVVAGLLIFAGVMSVFGWDFTKLSTEEYETAVHEVNEPFRNITIDTATADIEFVPSEDNRCQVVCLERENATHCVEVRDETLCIRLEEDKKWYDHISINFQSVKITVFLPKTEYSSVCINDNTGDIRIENIQMDTLDCSVTTGYTTLTDVQCQNLLITGSTGDVIFNNVTVADTLSVKISTGDVRFTDADAGKISVKTSTGNVTGSLLSEKKFITNSSTGRIVVPKTSSGGNCEITTSTGDILIKINEK